MDAAKQLYVALQHTAAKLRALDQELGLSPARFSILATLRFHGPQRLGDLARLEGVAQPTMTQTVRGLEAAGLARRGPAPDDRRGRIVELTPEGRALVRRARARKITWLQDALAPLTAAQHDALLAAAHALDTRP